MTDAETADRQFAVLNIVLVVLLFCLTTWQINGRELVSGVTTHPIGPCDLDWYSTRPALVLACPAHDMIKVWPLPVVQPWFEDPVDETPSSPAQMDVWGADSIA